jgi:hypothetical protein
MLRKLAGSVVLVALGAAPVVAQTIGTPVYMAPYRAFDRSELSGTFSDPGGSGWALEGAYRYGSGRFDIGIRGGLRDTPGDTWLLLGAELRGRAIQATEDFPLDGAFTVGIGGAFGDNSIGYIPFGLSLGRRVEVEGGTSFVPYVHPVLAPIFGHGSDLLVSVGFGVDIRLGRSYDIRVSGGIGDIDGIAIGCAWLR